uniref:hypothetical protein n=1 Tax=uncultured Altererythrobacter sp. TaxID=500840 RepID=UPI00263768CA|nr:hypothetical protein [uncultured Altererythrobacter sp.]
MAEVYVPFLLVLMSWNADNPDATMSVQTRLFIDQAACESHGQDIAAMSKADRESRTLRFPDAKEQIAKERFSWRCTQSPVFIQKTDTGS